ncbi:MAG: Hint domain-containing protein [Pseudomonadota bacterium]
MPNGGVITALLFQDFSFLNDNGQINPSQNGPFSLPSNATAQLASGAQEFSIVVDDDDPEFDDGFQDDPNPGALNQFLVGDETVTAADGTTTTLTDGSVLEVEFTLTATPQGGGPAIDLLFVAVGPGENAGDLQLVVATGPVIPGVTYDIEFKNDGGGTPYADIPCFGRGTLIDTPKGPRAVETLKVGDMIVTHGGARRIVWVDHQALFRPIQKRWPVRIARGALGDGLPYRDLTVSPQHAMLLRDPQLELHFETSEAFVRARHLVGLPGIERVERQIVEYFHIMLDGHDVIYAEGAETETFFPGPASRKWLTAQGRARLAALYPSLSDAYAPSPFATARPVLKAYEARVARHILEQDLIRDEDIAAYTNRSAA